MPVNLKLTHVIANRTVASVSQEGSSLRIEFADGSFLLVLLEDPMSSVMVRDAKGQVEYAD
jgi:hypothetical protein